MKELIFDTREAFDTWHDQVKADKGYPQVNFNAETGKPMPDKQQTVAFVGPITHPGKSDKRVVCEFNEKQVSNRLLKNLDLKNRGFAKDNGWASRFEDSITEPPK